MLIGVISNRFVAQSRLCRETLPRAPNTEYRGNGGILIMDMVIFDFFRELVVEQ